MGWNVVCDRIGCDGFEQKDVNVFSIFPSPARGFRGQSAEEVKQETVEYLAELFGLNAMMTNYVNGMLYVWNPEAATPMEKYWNFRAQRIYTLTDAAGKPYESLLPGQFGGHRKLKIYGRLDCKSASRYIAKGQYVQYRVFFADEETAIAAGYRPCAKCMKAEYDRWKQEQAAQMADGEIAEGLLLGINQ